MRRTLALAALLLSAAAPAAAEAPDPRAVVAACINLTEEALSRAEGSERARLEETLSLMQTALRGLSALGDAAKEVAPPVARLPERLEDCTGES